MTEDDEQLSETQAQTIPDQVLYWVAAYLVTLSYGGPEEGGWWFTSGELVTDPDIYRQLGSPPRAFFDRSEAHGALSRLEEHLPQLNAGRPPLSASTSTGLYELHVMHGPDLPQAFPRTRPTYA